MAAVRPDNTTGRRPKGGKYFGCVANPVHLANLDNLVACPGCGRGIPKSARYCFDCAKTKP